VYRCVLKTENTVSPKFITQLKQYKKKNKIPDTTIFDFGVTNTMFLQKKKMYLGTTKTLIFLFGSCHLQKVEHHSSSIPIIY